MEIPTLAIPSELLILSSMGDAEAQIRIMELTTEHSRSLVVFRNYIASFLEGHGRMTPTELAERYSAIYDDDMSVIKLNRKLCEHDFQVAVKDELTGNIVGYDLHEDAVKFNLGIKEISSGRISWNVGILNLLRVRILREEESPEVTTSEVIELPPLIES